MQAAPRSPRWRPMRIAFFSVGCGVALLAGLLIWSMSNLRKHPLPAVVQVEPKVEPRPVGSAVANQPQRDSGSAGARGPDSKRPLKREKDEVDVLPGERYAFLVGVRKYPATSGLRDLQYTERDVEELAEVLKTGGYRPENVMLMTQTQGAADTRYLPLGTNIEKELENLLRDRREADTVLVAFAGHGVQFQGEEEAFFCPANASLEDKTTLVSLTKVYRELDQCRARFKVLLSDACRNDPIAARARGRLLELESVSRPQRLQLPQGMAALFSCSEGETAYEHEELGHGVFFHYVIEGLRGAADMKNNGQIELEGLSLYTRQRVLDYVRAKLDGKRQMPHLVSNLSVMLPLVNVPRSQPQANPLANGPVANNTKAKRPSLGGSNLERDDARSKSPERDQTRSEPRVEEIKTEGTYQGIAKVTSRLGTSESGTLRLTIESADKKGKVRGVLAGSDGLFGSGRFTGTIDQNGNLVLKYVLVSNLGNVLGVHVYDGVMRATLAKGRIINGKYTIQNRNVALDLQNGVFDDLKAESP
jgi:hypothetical protein